MLKRSWAIRFTLLWGMVALLGETPPEEARYQFPFDQHRAVSGSFGELRTNHFHSGIDIKTNGRIGIPVRAIADGEVYRLRVGPYGYGKAVYLRHRDGRFSVYAHLNRFNDSIGQYVFAAQQAEEMFPQDLYVARGKFQVQQGDTIGFSGNSGSSTGPHLHFEIRDPDEQVIDPLPYFTDLIPDHRPPFVQEVSFDPIGTDSRIKGLFEKLRIVPTASGKAGSYVIRGIIPINGRVGLEYKAYDRLDGSSNYCGINFAKLYLDDQLIYNYKLDKFSFEETRSINLHIDYARFLDKKQRSQRAFIEYGNPFNAYTYANGRGLIEVFDDQVHAFRLELSDVHGNLTTVSGQVRRDTMQPTFRYPSPYRRNSTKEFAYKIKRDVLQVSLLNADSADIRGIYYHTHTGERLRWQPSYAEGRELIYLMKLDRFTYPVLIEDSLKTHRLPLFLTEEIFPDRNQVVSLEGLRVFFPYNSLFYPLHLEVEPDTAALANGVPLYRISDRHIPVQSAYVVSFDLPEIGYEHVVIAHWNGRKWTYVGNQRGPNHSMYAYTRELGEFTLLVDSRGPELIPLNFRANGRIPRTQSRLSLRVKDDFSGIDPESLHATLDGKWVLCEYRFQRAMMWHDLTAPLASGTHELVVRARDLAGNQVEKRITFRVS